MCAAVIPTTLNWFFVAYNNEHWRKLWQLWSWEECVCKFGLLALPPEHDIWITCHWCDSAAWRIADMVFSGFAWFQAPHSILCGSSRRFIQEANLWMSNGGTRSLIHYDSDHNIHCLLAGRKDFVMIPKKFQSQLYMASQVDTVMSNFTMHLKCLQWTGNFRMLVG